jgi:DNA-binding CsgD family transcriptional regulator
LSVSLLHPATASAAAVVVLHPTPGDILDGLEGFGLTPREREVARYIADGASAKEIASALGISVHTARHHTESIFAKLGVGTRVAVATMLRDRLGASSHGSIGAPEKYSASG